MDQTQKMSQLVKRACDGCVAAALAEVFDERPNRLSVYSSIRREAKPIGVLRGKKPQEPRIRCAKADLCGGGHMRCSAFFTERIAVLECGQEQGPILIRPRVQAQMLFCDGSHLIVPIDLAFLSRQLQTVVP